MTATIAMMNTSTGETRLIRDDYYDGDNYGWEEGSNSCDCNRAIFFCAAFDEDDSGRKCGHERYVINSIFYNGKFTYTELE